MVKSNPVADCSCRWDVMVAKQALVWSVNSQKLNTNILRSAIKPEWQRSGDNTHGTVLETSS